MTPLKWTQEMSCGVQSMDAAHQAMFASFAALAQAPEEEFCAGYQCLLADVERDFQQEEAEMDAIGFAGMQHHVEQHARVLAGLHHALPRVQEGDYALGRKVLELLPQWFALHVCTMDRALGKCLQTERGQSQVN